MVMDSPAAAQVFLQYLRVSYPIVLLVVFFAVFIAHSAHIAKDAGSSNDAVQYGPGGKPLPKRTRAMMMVSRKLPVELAKNKSKALFLSLTLCLLVTYIAEAAVHMLHAMIAKSQQWWPGQAVVVSFERFPSPALCYANKVTMVGLHCRFVLYAYGCLDFPA